MGATDPSSRGQVHKGELLLKIFGFGALLLAVAGCNTTNEGAPVAVVPADVGPATTAELQDPDDVKYYRSDEPLRMAIEHFNRGQYGIAERYFRDATEKAPKDPTAWIGLAAAYDRLARFDLADRAYVFAIRLVGETTEILNNQGYSYMLRCDVNEKSPRYAAGMAYMMESTTAAAAFLLQAACAEDKEQLRAQSDEAAK